MERIQSKVDVVSELFLRNREEYLAILQKYTETLAQVRKGGSETAVLRHKERGKLTARERIDALIDSNTPFLELSPLAAFNLYNNDFPSAGIVTGIGVIRGKETIIVANDATVKGGTYVKETIKNTCARRKSQWIIICPAFTWSIPAESSFRSRQMYSRINTISEDFFIIRHASRPQVFHRFQL